MSVITTTTSSSRLCHALVALAIAASGVSSIAGCRSASTEHARAQRRMITALSAAKDAVCACADLTCAEDAERRLADTLLLHVDRFKRIPAPKPGVPGLSDAIATQAAQLDGELRACKRRLEEAARAS